ncbi:unnamed protein product [Thlaspi arvense]|uniref:Uncharacterized protein n=1 Tax=Thlaspi arvense TaxID=13288 RepID=A0AAU9R6S7_THLAR|nr:unnamed protein product [Thlaspi arvense]
MHFAKDKRGILPVGDIADTIPDEEADIAVLEEPEHRTWFHHGKKWKTKFNYVIGIVHTNYLEYVKRGKQGRLKAFLLKYLIGLLAFTATRHDGVAAQNRLVLMMQVIRLSAATQEYPKSIVRNVHGVNPKFLKIGLRKQEHEEQPFSAYYIGKMVLSKGYKELLELLTRHQKELAGGEDSEDIKKAVEKLDLKVNVYPGRDHADSPFHNYRVFFNPSTTDMVCTTTAEALAIGKTIFPNCRVYDDEKVSLEPRSRLLGNNHHN